MEFLKRNLFILVCLAVGLVSIGLGMLACNRFDAIRESMQEGADLGDQVAGAGRAAGRKQPIAPIDITIQQQNIDTIQGEVRAVREKALVVGGAGLDYLVPEAFPDPKRDLHLPFIREYNNAIKALPALLHAKGPPSEEDVKKEEEKIEAENEKLGVVSTGSGSARSGSSPPARRSGTGRRGSDSGGGGPRIRGLSTPSGRDRPAARPTRADAARKPDATKPVSEAEALRTDAKRRAELQRAREIRCYVDPKAFTVVERARDPKAPADPAEMWRAQASLWVQREICKALNSVNEEAARALKAAKGDARIDVTTLPVKRLIRLEVGDYRAGEPLAAVSAKGKRGAGASKSSKATEKRGRTGAGRPRRESFRAKSGGPSIGVGGLGRYLQRDAGRRVPTAAQETPADEQMDLQTDLTGPTWTGREGGEDLDVVPVAMKLVMDVRYLPQVISRICRSNFYVTTRVSYRALNRSELSKEYVYGPEPVVEVILAFERYFFPKVYAEKMPLVVHRRLGHAPEPGPEGKGRGRGRRKRARG